MLSDFKSYQLSVQFHRDCGAAALPYYLRYQLMRASSSVALNLAEGSAKRSPKDQARFYGIALASLRECQAALDLAPRGYPELVRAADILGAHLRRLCRARSA